MSSRSLLAIAEGPPHWIQSAEPDLAAEAIRLVVASVRSGKALPACADSSRAAKVLVAVVTNHHACRSGTHENRAQLGMS
ncbi:MAG: hypothetical protein ACXVY8_02265 [Gaiellaceae bacterium]